MLYHVSGTLAARELLTAPHSEFVDFISKLVVPSLTMLRQWQAEGIIVGGGVRSCSPDVYFVLRLPAPDSHLAVRQLLTQLPIYVTYQWQVTPLETFEEWTTLVS